MFGLKRLFRRQQVSQYKPCVKQDWSQAVTPRQLKQSRPLEGSVTFIGGPLDGQRHSMPSDTVKADGYLPLVWMGNPVGIHRSTPFPVAVKRLLDCYHKHGV